MALSDTSIRNAKPANKTYKLYDSDGLFIQITPNGGKWWRLKYRFNGKEKLLSLGTYPEVSLASARDKRDSARKLLASDPPIDPSEKRKTAKAENKLNTNNSFELIAREWWQSYMKDKKDSHKQKVIRRFENFLFPYIGNKPVATITAPQVLEPIKLIEKLNKLESAHRTLQAAGQVFRYAVQHGFALRDVTADLKGALPPRKVKHMAAFTEPKQIAELLRAIDSYKCTLTVQCALKLSPLVFVRPGELRQAKWRDIDLDAGEWRYLVSKTNTDHLVPLSTQAIEILRTIQPISGHGEFVFHGLHSHLRPMSEAAINSALKRMGYDTQSEITGHGFRAMARTILHERLNIDPYIIEHQLAHKVPDTLGTAYNRTRFIEQRKDMMQKWADYLDELKAGAKVISLEKV